MRALGVTDPLLNIRSMSSVSALELSAFMVNVLVTVPAIDDEAADILLTLIVSK